MLPSNLIAHCSLINVTVMFFIIALIVALPFRFKISLKLNNRFMGSNRLLDDDRPSDSKAADDYFNGRYFNLKNYSVSHGDSDLISQNQISVKIYSQEDVVKCFDSLSSSAAAGGNQRPMYFAFVGDSTVRQHFVSFLRWIPDYDRITTTTNSSWFTDVYFHEDRNVTSALLNHLRVSYYWRFLIKQDLLADFEPWASADNHANETSPDFILLGITAHHVGSNPVTDSLEMYVKLLEDKLIPLIKKSLAAHPRQKIVWLHQSRTVVEMMPSHYDIYPDDIAKYNKEIRRLFEYGTGVVIWDSINTVVDEYVRACALTEHERSDRKAHASCYDFIHPGFGALSLGTQLIFNHLCGAIDIN